MRIQCKQIPVASAIFSKGLKALFFVNAFALVFFFGCKNNDEEGHEMESEGSGHSEVTASGNHATDEHKADTSHGVKSKKQNEVAVTPPPFSDGIFPCTGCHSDLKPNPERRALVEMHDDIDAMFTHDNEHRWCLDCHDLNNRDSLRLASGKKIGFEESYKLCGQCHGDKYRDWRAGVHGKRTGNWDGEKLYRLCVSCHNPHAPRFAPIQPLPPPVRQEDIKM